MAGLIKHPGYRESHGTDDYFIAACFVAGLCGEVEDEKIGESGRGILGTKDWELTNMTNSQFTLGSWPKGVENVN